MISSLWVHVRLIFNLNNSFFNWNVLSIRSNVDFPKTWNSVSIVHFYLKSFRRSREDVHDHWNKYSFHLIFFKSNMSKKSVKDFLQLIFEINKRQSHLTNFLSIFHWIIRWTNQLNNWNQSVDTIEKFQLIKWISKDPYKALIFFSFEISSEKSVERNAIDERSIWHWLKIVFVADLFTSQKKMREFFDKDLQSIDGKRILSLKMQITEKSLINSRLFIWNLKFVCDQFFHGHYSKSIGSLFFIDNIFIKCHFIRR